jgi:hypothetical protein
MTLANVPKPTTTMNEKKNYFLPFYLLLNRDELFGSFELELSHAYQVLRDFDQPKPKQS